MDGPYGSSAWCQLGWGQRDPSLYMVSHFPRGHPGCFHAVGSVQENKGVRCKASQSLGASLAQHPIGCFLLVKANHRADEIRGIVTNLPLDSRN